MPKVEGAVEAHSLEHYGEVSGRWPPREPEAPPQRTGSRVRTGEPVTRGRRSETHSGRGPLPRAAAFLLQTCAEASGRSWTARELAGQCVNPAERAALLQLQRIEEQRGDIAREALQNVWGVAVGRC